jgi:hypothetical protein
MVAGALRLPAVVEPLNENRRDCPGSSMCSTAAMPSISVSTRAALNRALGAEGVYVSEESAHTFIFPRTDVSLQVDGQRLSPAQAPKSWATFSPSMHHKAMVNAELILRRSARDGHRHKGVDVGHQRSRVRRCRNGGQR